MRLDMDNLAPNGTSPAASAPSRRQRILIVEDEPMVAEVVERYLRRDGCDVAVVHDGALALAEFARCVPDLVVLDVMLPGIDGIELCQRIRARGDTAIIMLTARTEEIDKLIGLGVGADDYVTKPFSPRELVARVQTVLRRAVRPQTADGESLRFGDVSLNSSSRTVENARGPVPLTAREFDLLLHLARHPGHVFTRDQLMSAIWDQEFVAEASTVTVHMRRLRAKVEADPARPRHLKTVWGVGYKFEP